MPASTERHKNHSICRFIAAKLFVAAAVALTAGDVRGDSPNLQDDVLPLLKVRCVSCHGPAKQEAGLNLALPPAIARGGDSGSPVAQGKPEQSLLWKRVAADEMPPDAPLPREEKALLQQWIAANAPGLPENVSPQADGDEHWAFQRLRPTTAPPVRDRSRVRTPVDEFIQAQLEAIGLSLSPEAPRETLIRRVSFDLTGLPPTIEEIEAFVRDESDHAYEAMVDRYLSSPRYGERWGKYWLDAAGYADSNGYVAEDSGRPLAYRYRDYVIRSINADKPFDEFIREQLAGDEIAKYHPGAEVTPQLVERLEATHFLRNSPDGTDNSDGNEDEMLAEKYAVLEGTVQIIGSSLLGLTLQCSKCHDHKFEPITQRDYYQLQAVIYPAFNVQKWIAPKERTLIVATAAEKADWNNREQQTKAAIAAAQKDFADWVRANRPRGQVVFEDRFDGSDIELALHWNHFAPGSAAPTNQSPPAVDSALSPQAQTTDGVLRIAKSDNETTRALCTQKDFDWTPETEGAWVQVTFDFLNGDDTASQIPFLLAMRDPTAPQKNPGGNVLIDGTAGAARVYVDFPGCDKRDAGQIGKSGYTPGRNYGVRVTNVSGKFQIAHLVDGLAEPGSIELTADDLPDGKFGFAFCHGRGFRIDNLSIEKSDQSSEFIGSEFAGKEKQFAEARAAKQKELATRTQSLTAALGDQPGKVAGVIDPSGDVPEVHLLARGEYKMPADLVVAAGPKVLSSGPAASDPFALPEATKNTTGRRLAFANWITEPDSRAASLLARVTVNRWWQHHFTTGLVSTADNLGYSGSAPTDQQLLDFLAQEFIRSGWSAKSLHRLILHSAVYRQSSVVSPEAKHVDPDNRRLGHYPLHRLDAEALRDAMLSVCGQIDLRAGGPAVPTRRLEDGDVVVDENSPNARRRSVYLQQRRTQVLGLLEAFDAPSIVVNCATRARTTVPLQSLKLLNSDFIRVRSTALARRIATEAGNDLSSRLRHAYMLVFGRPASSDEMSKGAEFIAAQEAEYQSSASPNSNESAWIDFCQALLASNGFIYVQ